MQRYFIFKDTTEFKFRVSHGITLIFVGKMLFELWNLLMAGNNLAFLPPGIFEQHSILFSFFILFSFLIFSPDITVKFFCISYHSGTFENFFLFAEIKSREERSREFFDSSIGPDSALMQESDPFIEHYDKVSQCVYREQKKKKNLSEFFLLL